ncbi:hypothetical protein [Methanogenium sp. MK-MG]|uniref:hypothetical protein n=1 Tax=Methanogenium sp. MK-MG TaxID=2599926 RepID=UPI0013E9F008|nr:hypothetical protein [Methanogenium sp. MK-MG]KAF1078092.1 hypothetical protein MKMG_01012 [Methanogenium sp. MK-MG]
MRVYARLTLLVCMSLFLVCGAAVAIQPPDLNRTVTIDGASELAAFTESPAAGGFIAAGATEDGPAVWFVAADGTVTGNMTVAIGNASVIRYVQENEDGYSVFTDTHDFAGVSPKGEILWTWHVPCGEVSSVDAVPAGGIIAAANYLNPTIYRLDADGTPLWNRSYADTSGAGLGRIQSVKAVDGGYIAAGYARPLITSADSAGLVMYLDEEGNVIWEERYGEEGIGYVVNINPLPNGGYIAPALTTADEAAVLILNATGAATEVFSYPKRMELIYYADAAPSGGYYLLGYDASLVNGDPQFLAMGVSPDGKEEWMHWFGDIPVRAFIPTSDGFAAAGENGEISFFTFHETGKETDFSDAWMFIFVILAAFGAGYLIYRQR